MIPRFPSARTFRSCLLPFALLTLSGPGAWCAPPDTANGDYGGFYTWPEIEAKIASLEKQYPALIYETSLGKTLEGRDIPLLRFSAHAAQDKLARDPKASEVLLLDGIHPREQQPQICTLHLMDDLLAGYGHDPKITHLLDTGTVWIVPIFNVDGKVYDMQHGNGTTVGADWRKNRRPNPDGTFGVDLNRNFGVSWGANRHLNQTWQQYANDTHADIYEGPAPLSEPETQALVRFIASRPLRAMVDFHSPLHKIILPAYLTGPDYDRFHKIAAQMTALQRVPYPVTAGRPDAEPPDDGHTGDTGLTYTWAYYTQGVYAFNIETALKGHYPPPGRIDQEYQDNLKGPLLALLEDGESLPLPTPGHAVYKSGTTDGPLVPGATVHWRPVVDGPCDYGVLVSADPSVIVLSEYRLFPLKRGFTLQVMPNAVPGKPIPMTLYLWGRDHTRSVQTLALTVRDSSEPSPATLASRRISQQP